MAKTKVSQFDATASNNTDINSVNVAEGCPPSGINNAIREMASLLKKQEVGTDAMTSPDIDGGTIDGATIGASSASTGAFTTISASGNTDLNGTLNVQGETTLQTHLNMGDNDTIKLGASADLSIFHDGSNSHIVDSGTGNLNISATNFNVFNAGGTEQKIGATSDGAVELFHNNSSKFSTSSTGVTVTGNIANSSGDFKLDVAGDITIDASGGNINFKDDDLSFVSLINNSSDAIIQAGVQDKDIKFKGNDGGSIITALTLDISDAGTASFNHDVNLNGNLSAGQSIASDSTVNALSVTGGLAGSQLNAQLKFFGKSVSNTGVTYETGRISGGSTSSSVSLSGGLVFSTSSNNGSNVLTLSEKMRLTDSGNLLLGTTTATGFKIDCDTNSGNGIFVQRIGSGLNGFLTRASNSHSYNAMRFDNVSASIVGTISVSTSGTTYNTSSDYRLKENVEDMTDATSRLKKLQPKRFNFISDETNTLVDGFLAHEAQAVVPECVTGEKDATNEDGSIKPQGIDQSKIVPLLTKALQEQQATIEALTARITTLENA